VTEIPRLSISELSKSFSVPVLNDINLSIAAGEVHAIVGENGAGKSTFVNILAGLLQKDAGTMMLDGEIYAPANPRAAFAAGVSCALQELSTIGTLSVAENIAVRNLPHEMFVIAKGRLAEQAQDLMRRVGLEVSPDMAAESLSLADRQLLELAKALSSQARLLILDEPTAALTGPQAKRLHEIIREVSAAGSSVIYISHRLDDVLAVANVVTVLRDGQVVASAPAATMSTAELLQYMSGGNPARNEKTRNLQQSSATVLAIENVTTDALPHPVSFNCSKGEIIGLAGLAGSGRSELLAALFGLVPLRAGHIDRCTVAGRTRVRNAGQAVNLGMAYLGEDRQSMGLFRAQSVLLNMMVPGERTVSSVTRLIDGQAEAAAGADFVDRLAIKCEGLQQDVDQLSGGNQQKVLIARWLNCKAAIFLLDEPTRGVDVGTKNAIYELLFEIRDGDNAIVMASSEIDELMTVCDRILVLSRRKLVQTFFRGDWSEQDILATAFSEFAASGRAAQHHGHTNAVLQEESSR
jgi:ribose transport system ATP-binding protein